MKIIHKNYISIKVNEHYTYDCMIQGMGNPSDSPSGFTAWSWVNHLREKNWWGQGMENEFIKLARQITGE
jgi:hypothetical protein